jgi:galactokinase
VLAVCDTGVRRALEDSGYAIRRRECAEAVQWLRGRGRPITSLRDVTVDDLPGAEKEMPEPLRRRLRHVVTENARVIEAARALEGGKPEDLGPIFRASHQSLRDDYEVSSSELDAMVDAALASPGCLAARMTGAGFGGAVVALVRRSEAQRFLAAVTNTYRQHSGREGAFLTAEPAGGATVAS